MEEIDEETDFKEIKVLEIDNVREYKRDQFLWFGQNNGIYIHFTVRK